MRSHAKAMILLVGLLATMLLGASAAQAANHFLPVGVFGFEEGVVDNPTRMAVENSSGHVLVVDRAHNQVQVFGVEVTEPGGTKVTTGTLLTTFGGGELSSPFGVAIDQANGDVYVTDVGNTRIRRYTTDGAVTPTYTLDPTYTSPALSPVPGAGAPDGTIGSFESSIAIDPTNGDLLIADNGNNRVSRFDDTGAFVSDFDGADSTDGAFTHLEDIAFSPAGKIFAADSTAPSARDGGLSRVLRFSGAGAFEATLRPLRGEGDAFLAYDSTHDNLVIGDARSFSTRFIAIDPADGAEVSSASSSGQATATRGIAVDPGSERLYAAAFDPFCETSCSFTFVQVFESQTYPALALNPPTGLTSTAVHLSGTVDPEGLPTSYRFEISKDNGATWIAGPDTDAGEGSSPVAAGADFVLEPNTTYLARLVASNPNVTDFASPPQSFTSSLSAPEALTGEVTGLTPTAATLNGKVNPFGSSTSYYFEYGPTSSYGSRVPADVDALAGAGRVPLAVSKDISGLQPGVTYHYRFVAANGGGTNTGVDRTFTTSVADSPQRAFELVSPAAKNGKNVYHQRMYASADGNAIAYKGGYNVLPDLGSEAGPYFPQFVASRSDAGWTNSGVDPQQGSFEDTEGAVYIIVTTVAVSHDGTKALVGSTKALAPGAIEGGSNLYLEDTRTRAMTTVVAYPDPEWWTNHLPLPATYPGRIGMVAGTENFDHIVFYAFDGNSPGVSLLPGVPYRALYEFSHGQLRVASVGPDGNPLGAALPPLRDFDRQKVVLSENGSTLFFEARLDPTALPGTAAATYVRVGGQTRLISESRKAKNLGATMPARYVGASRDGSVAYILSQDLTEDSTADEGYLYRYTVATGKLEIATRVGPVTGSDPALALQVSADGKTVYFVSSQALTGAPIKGPSVYVLRDGQLSMVASLDADPQLSNLSLFSVAASSSGRYLAFAAQSKLTSYDTVAPGVCLPDATEPLDVTDGIHCLQVYRYDADAKELTCASCPPDNRQATGTARFAPPNDEYATEQVIRAATNSGQVFFDTPDALVSGDINAARDVYEYDGTNRRLISSGHGFKSRLAAVGGEGRDVFFTTQNKLVRVDADESADLYDARVGGGFAWQNEIPGSDCLGDDCRGLPPTPPTPPPGGSETTFGPGNDASRKGRCPKGRKARKVKGKQRCVKQKKSGRKQSRTNTNRRQSR